MSMIKALAEARVMAERRQVRTQIASPFSIVAIALGVLLHAGAAQALQRTWVSHAGNDSNTCESTSPCLTFQGAYQKTAAGGEIDVLDGGDFGPLVIQRAITIANDGAGAAGIMSAGIGIQIQALPTDAVVLRGLNLNGLNSFVSGIQLTSGASLLIDHCTIQGFQSGAGIVFGPGSAAQLWVLETVLSSDGISSEAGVWIVPQGGAAVTAHFERVQILHATGNGIRVDDTQGGGAIDVELHDVTVDGATGGSGIVAVSQTSGGPAVKLTADEVTSSHNAGYGVRAVGGTASVFLSRSTITDNAVGIGVSSGGAVASYSDNRFAGNSIDGSPTTLISLK
jgi:hypothetical protein